MIKYRHAGYALCRVIAQRRGACPGARCFVCVERAVDDVHLAPGPEQTFQGREQSWQVGEVLNRRGEYHYIEWFSRKRSLVRFGLKDDYWKTYSQRVQNLTLKDVQNVAKTIVQPNNLGWFLAGDAEKVLPGLKELGMEVIQIDADGNVVSKKAKP